MANYQSTLLIALLCLIATSVARASYVVDGNSIARVVIPGHLYCTATLNFEPGALGLPGVDVFLQCGSAQTSLTRVITDGLGDYQIVLAITDTITFDAATCFIVVKLPIASCAVLPPTGTLQAPISLLNVVSSATGFVANLVVGAFHLA